jgi:hypothetical protein
MKVVITGHTTGLGLAIYNYFKEKGCEVIGYSRSNGHKLPEAFDSIVSYAKSADLFVNNTYVDDIQSRFIEKLYQDVSIITIGSMAADFPQLNTRYQKFKLFTEQTHTKFNRMTNKPLLLIKPGYLENYPNNFPIQYQEIVDAINYWLKHPRVSQIILDNDFYFYKK